MKVAYNKNDLGLYPLDEIYFDPCENCIFIKQEKSTCTLIDFGEVVFDKLPDCWNSIFIPESLSSIFEL